MTRKKFKATYNMKQRYYFSFYFLVVKIFLAASNLKSSSSVVHYHFDHFSFKFDVTLLCLQLAVNFGIHAKKQLLYVHHLGAISTLRIPFRTDIKCAMRMMQILRIELHPTNFRIFTQIHTKFWMNR